MTLKLNKNDIAWAMEQLSGDIPMKAVAVDLGVHVSTLSRTLELAELNGFELWERGVPKEKSRWNKHTALFR